MHIMTKDLHVVSNRQRCLNSTLSRIEGSIDCHSSIEAICEIDMTKLGTKANEAIDLRHRQQQEILKIKRNMTYLPNTAMDYRCENIPMTGALKESTEECHAQGEAIQGIEKGSSGGGLQLQSPGQESPEVTQIPPKLRASDQNGDNPCPSPSTMSALDYSIILKLSQNSCNSACHCACHRRNSFKSPNFLNSILGSLFVAYEPSPWSAQACESLICRKRSQKLTYTYAFPRWFLHRVLVMNMAFSPHQGPEFVLRMMKISSHNRNIFQTLPMICGHEKKYIQHVERWMDKGLLSVLDVSTIGLTHLHVRDCLQDTLSSIHTTDNDVKYALFTRNYRIAEMLIRRGADLYYEDMYRR